MSDIHLFKSRTLILFLRKPLVYTEDTYLVTTCIIKLFAGFRHLFYYYDLELYHHITRFFIITNPVIIRLYHKPHKSTRRPSIFLLLKYPDDSNLGIHRLFAVLGTRVISKEA